MRMTRARVAASLLALAAFACTAHDTLAAPPPAEAFGQVPEVARIEISPSGKLVAWGDYVDPTPKVRIFDLEQQKTLRVIAIDPGVELRKILWTDDETLLFNVSLRKSYASSGGDRFVSQVYRTLAADVSGGPARILLMGDSATRGLQSGSNLLAVRTPKPKTVMMWTWAEGPRDSGWVASVLEVDTGTGKGKLITQGSPLTNDWIVDRSGRPVVRSDWDPQQRTHNILAEVNGSWREIHRQVGQLAFAGLGADGSSVLAVGSVGQGRDKLLSIPFDGSGAKILLEDPQRDVLAVVLDPYTRAPLGAWLGGSVDEVRWLDARTEAQQQAVARAFPDRRALIVSRSENRKRVIVDVSSASIPTTYYLVDFATGNADIIGEEYPKLTHAVLGEVRTISYKARDGFEIPAYVTIPPETKAEKLPLVVLPHGGPESRDEPAFDWLAQFLATRGYAVLQPQFRGSTGFGEAHRVAGYRQWGGLMQDDVTDGVKALIAQGLADPARVCIVGATYGGYAALAGAAFTPELYRCAVSINGVSDLPGLVTYVGEQSTKDSDAYRYMLATVGSPSDAKLAQRSPVRAAGGVRARILLMHGVNDTIVPIAQTEKMAKALDKAGKPYDFVKLPGEDHWLSRTDTRVRVLIELSAFLGAQL